LLFGTGDRNYDKIMNKIKESGITLSDNIKIVSYIDNMAECMAAADVVVSRAGAITVSEIAALGKPSILIPSPNVTHNHQEFNASALVKESAAIMIKENVFDKSSLSRAVDKLLDNDALRKKYGENAYKLAQKDASKLICESIMKFASR